LLADITVLLQRSARGDKNAREQLYAVVYPELMRIARIRLSASGTITLDAPGLLHEACLRFVDRDDVTFSNRRIFFAYASSVMRNVIVDCARARLAEKRGSVRWRSESSDWFMAWADQYESTLSTWK